MGKRDNQILQILADQGRTDVADLARDLDVSTVTVRKDLDALCERGIVQREHGSAFLGSTDDINGRLARHYDQKRRIAKAALDLVQDGETTMIESGSCCALLAAAIADRKDDVTIVTNSAFIAAYVRDRTTVSVIMLGGAYQRDAQVMVGPLLGLCAREFCVDHLFIGTDGFTPSGGFTNADPFRAQAVRDMSAQAAGVVVLTESEKFSQRGVVPLHLGGRLSCVITDSGIPAGAADALRHGGVDVRVVEP